MEHEFTIPLPQPLALSITLSISINLNPLGTSYKWITVAVSFYIPTNGTQVFLFLHIITNTWLFITSF